MHRPEGRGDLFRSSDDGELAGCGVHGRNLSAQPDEPAPATRSAVHGFGCRDVPGVPRGIMSRVGELVHLDVSLLNGAVERCQSCLFGGVYASGTPSVRQSHGDAQQEEREAERHDAPHEGGGVNDTVVERNSGHVLALQN